MSRAAAVGEEISAAGCSLLLIVVSPAIVGSILARHGTEAQREGRWLPGDRRRDDQGRVRDHRARRRHELAQPLDRGDARDGDLYRLRGTKTYISGVEDADAILVIARKREADGNARPAAADASSTPTPPGSSKQFIPIALKASDKQWTLFFDDVEVPADRAGRRVGDRRAEGRLRRPQPGADHGRRGLATASGAGRSRSPPTYARERVVWKTPIGAHQGLSHPLAQAKIELELARLMTQKAAALYDAGAPAGEPANMAKYAAAEAAIKCVDQAIQTHGGNGFALEYGLTDMYWGARLVRTAPVSREMILNYVAEHSLGLPRSY